MAKKTFTIAGVIIMLICATLWLFSVFSQKNYEIINSKISQIQNSTPPAEKIQEIKFIPAPKEVKAIYATAPTVSISKRLDNLIQLINATELNSIVINIKDGEDLYLTEWMAKVVAKLKENNIYAIARIVAFEDADLAHKKPRLALKTKTGELWQKKNFFWVDPASQEVWDYNVDVANSALEMGFEEINFDYIRFPSDGNISGIKYPVYDKTISKEQIIADFSKYAVERIKKSHPQAVVSADVFAFNFLTDDDLGIGQRLKLIAPQYDVVAPMIYPSHYSVGNFGFKNPAEHPYEVVLNTLLAGKTILTDAGATDVKIRPWIQDFDLGADYTPEMVRLQIKAIEDAGYHDGWMLWNPSNIYSAGALLPE